MQDALPDATLPIYLGLGRAIRNALACEHPMFWEVNQPDTLFSKIHISLDLKVWAVFLIVTYSTAMVEKIRPKGYNEGL